MDDDDLFGSGAGDRILASAKLPKAKQAKLLKAAQDDDDEPTEEIEAEE